MIKRKNNVDLGRGRRERCTVVGYEDAAQLFATDVNSINIPTSNIITPSSRYLEHFANGLHKFLQQDLDMAKRKRFCANPPFTYVPPW